MIESYLEALEGWWVEDIEEAFRRSIKVSKFFPVPAELTEILREIVVERAPARNRLRTLEAARQGLLGSGNGSGVGPVGVASPLEGVRKADFTPKSGA